MPSDRYMYQRLNVRTKQNIHSVLKESRTPQTLSVGYAQGPPPKECIWERGQKE